MNFASNLLEYVVSLRFKKLKISQIALVNINKFFVCTKADHN